jgi:hypothetical protein
MRVTMLRLFVHAAHLGGYAILCLTHPGASLDAHAYSLLLLGALLHTIEAWWSQAD